MTRLKIEPRILIWDGRSPGHCLELHHRVVRRVGLVRRCCRGGCHLLPHDHLVVVVVLLEHDVVGHMGGGGGGGNVSPPGRQLVVIGTVRLEHLDEETVLALVGYGERGAVQVVKEGGVGKHVQEVLGTLGSSLPTGQEERGLALRREREGERERERGGRRV